MAKIWLVLCLFGITLGVWPKSKGLNIKPLKATVRIYEDKIRNIVYCMLLLLLLKVMAFSIISSLSVAYKGVFEAKEGPKIWNITFNPKK